MLAVTIQVFLPGSMAVAQSNGVDVSQFICAPAGEASPESQASAERIAAMLGQDAPNDQTYGGHCPLCTLSHGVPLPEPVSLTALNTSSHEQVYVRYELDLVRKAQGPPLGSRGPPSHI